MNAFGKTCRLYTSMIGLLIAGAAIAAPPASAQIAKPQQMCINQMERDFAFVDKQVGRQVASCLKSYAKERPLSPTSGVDTVFECAADDPRLKLQLATQRAHNNFSRRCTPPLPAFGPTDPFAVTWAGRLADQGLSQDIWTENAENHLALERIDRPSSSCQQKVWKAVTKCEQAKIKEFGRCTRRGLVGLNPPGLIDSASDLQNLCLGTGTAPQPDPKKKAARLCGDPKKGIQKVIKASCKNVSLTALFPTCGSGTPAGTAACLDRLTSCRTCMALNAANHIDRDCELFDDGLGNNSCACGDGGLDAGEQCDDGNNWSGDGCTYDCRVEIG